MTAYDLVHSAAARQVWQQQSIWPTDIVKRHARAVVGACVFGVKQLLFTDI